MSTTSESLTDPSSTRSETMTETLERWQRYCDFNSYSSEELQPVGGKALFFDRYSNTMRLATIIWAGRVPEVTDGYACWVSFHEDLTLEERIYRLGVGVMLGYFTILVPETEGKRARLAREAADGKNDQR